MQEEENDKAESLHFLVHKQRKMQICPLDFNFALLFLYNIQKDLFFISNKRCCCTTSSLMHIITMVWSVKTSARVVGNRELAQQDSWKTRDGRMMKKCRARLCSPSLKRHFFVIPLSRVSQLSCCVSSLIMKWETDYHNRHYFSERETRGENSRRSRFNPPFSLAD